MHVPFSKNRMEKKVKIVLPLLMVLFAWPSFAQSVLEVTVENIKEAKGTIRVGLFKNEETFLKKAVEGKVVKASSGQLTVRFENLNPGEYGISVFHDENENSELDKNVMGIPKEGFAFGNNAMGMFGPPSFNDAKVAVPDKTKVTQLIKLKYF
jgi:uncharacterized protein (DUF2141 family)